MKKLSDIASKVSPSTTLAVDAMAKQQRAEGRDVIGFAAGEPDFDTPDNIRSAAVKALEDGQTRYTPAAGIVPLRKAICERLRADCCVDYDFRQITIASGAKHSIYIAFMTVLNPGDEVILPAPYWISYYEMIKMAGGVPVIVEGTEAAGFKITPEQLEAAVTDKTKMFLLNNPSNPTGMLYSGDELAALSEVCVEHDLYIMADEIYYNLVYDNREFVSLPSLGEEIKERTILINGVSKSYAMTGWRVGYAAASEEISKIMASYLSHSTGAPATMAQYAALEAMRSPQDSVRSMRAVFEKRRNYTVDRIGGIDGVSCTRPDGAFYVMMNIEGLKGRRIGERIIQNGDDFALSLLEKAQVAVIPCSGFGAPDFVRLTYAASMENIKEGLDRIEKFLQD